MEKADKKGHMDIEPKGKEELLNAPGLKLAGENSWPTLTILQNCINNVKNQITEKQTMDQQNMETQPRNSNHYNRNPKIFLGAHPVSLTKDNLSNKLLKPAVEFLTCEKSDGIRYLLFLTNSGDAILQGRTKEFHLVNIPMTRTIIDKRDKQSLIQYLFDGELIFDETKGKKFLRFLIFDCIISNFETVFSLTYIKRLERALEYINTIELLKKFVGKAKILPQLTPETRKLEEITLYVKDFYFTSAKNPTNPEFFIKNLAPRLSHKNDGIIFTQIKADYAIGKTETILKWKNPDQNSIDFLIVNNYSLVPRFGKTIVDLYVGTQDQKTRLWSFVLFDFMIVNEKKFDEIGKDIGIYEERDLFRYKEAGKDRIGHIAECRYDRDFFNDVLADFLKSYSSGQNYVDELLAHTVLHDGTLPEASKNLKTNLESKKKIGRGNWEWMKRRVDKPFPNELEVAKKVYASIQENITIENLREQVFLPHTQNHTDPGPYKSVKK